jgi:hypothetical protein
VKKSDEYYRFMVSIPKDEVDAVYKDLQLMAMAILKMPEPRQSLFVVGQLVTKLEKHTTKRNLRGLPSLYNPGSAE